MTKRRYALVGAGSRASLYIDALNGEWASAGELAALCDTNRGRLEHYAAQFRQTCRPSLYTADEFDRMLAESGAQELIITTPCSSHADYACRAMRAGLDVLCEKALAVNARQIQAILEARKESGRSLRVTFNLRYAPPSQQLKHLLMSGVIGEVLSIDFHWLLNTSHGADYFRRWHRHKAISGGLQIHKATHHFDLIAWLLSDVPEWVTAQGGLRWYTPGTAERLGLHQRGQRCLGCAEAEKCPFYLNLTADPGLKALYYDQEGWDGYLRDQCVFSAGTDIEDVLHALVRFRGGVEMNYSLHAWMPWEGFTIAVNGSKGRLEHVHRETVYANGERDGRLEPEIRTRIIPHFSNGWEEEIWKGEGLHGGGDERLLADIFATPPPPDPLCLRADERGGAWAALLGAGINLSLAEGGWVNLSDMVQGLDFPAYAPMPRPGESFVLRRGESLREHGLP